MKIRRKHLIEAGSLAVVAALAALALRDDEIQVDAATVRETPLQVTVDAEGKTRVRDRYVLAAPVAGRLERLRIPEGTYVRAGDVVARIAPVPLDVQSLRQAEARLAAARASVDQVEGAVRQAQARLEHERRASSRIARLAAAGALADRDREESELRVRLLEEEAAAASARVGAAVAEVEQARAALVAVGGGSPSAILVRAPAAGYVLRVPERSERVLSAGAPIAEIGDPGALELVIDVLSSDAARIRSGQRVLVDGFGGEAEAPVQGRVRLVEPAAFTRVSALGVEEQRVNVLIDIRNAPKTLGDGYRVEARVVVWESARAVSVPVSALFRLGEGWRAFAIDDGRATSRRVRVGEIGSVDAQVLSGLEPGEQVVVFPSDQLEDGARVTTSR
jgi:HlyD family secretion protein